MLNQAQVVGKSEEESLRHIIAEYHEFDDADAVTFELLSSESGPNAGMQKTYTASYLSEEIAIITINSFLDFGWQKLRYERVAEDAL